MMQITSNTVPTPDIKQPIVKIQQARPISDVIAAIIAFLFVLMLTIILPPKYQISLYANIANVFIAKKRKELIAPLFGCPFDFK